MENKRIQNGTNPLLLASVIFGCFGIFATVLNQNFSVYFVVFVINIVQLIIFTIITITKREKLKIERGLIFKLMIFGIANSFPILFFNLAISNENISTVLLIQNLSTIIFSVLYSNTIL
jgi:uncharacterized membrane protein